MIYAYEIVKNYMLFLDGFLTREPTKIRLSRTTIENLDRNQAP